MHTFLTLCANIHWLLGVIYLLKEKPGCSKAFLLGAGASLLICHDIMLYYSNQASREQLILQLTIWFVKSFTFFGSLLHANGAIWTRQYFTQSIPRIPVTSLATYRLFTLQFTEDNNLLQSVILLVWPFKVCVWLILRWSPHSSAQNNT